MTLLLAEKSSAFEVGVALLLDTHYVFAIAGTPGRLSRDEIRVLGDPRETFVVSAVSIWEIRLKWNALHATGERKGPAGPAEILRILSGQAAIFLPMSLDHAAAALAVPLGHSDPFDELLLVQAQQDRHRLLTRDAKLLGHPLAVSVRDL